jgi:hypothetical protein
MVMPCVHGVNFLDRNFRSHSFQIASKELEDVHVAQYTVRVELHKANSDDYENLHGYMEQEDFIRYVVNSNDGLKYRLPTAEYNISSTGGKGTVLKKAKQAASRTGKKYMVLVTESDGRTWFNLPVWEG